MTNELEEALKKSVKWTMTPEEKFLQMVSFVYGNDFKSTRTKKEVAASIIKHGAYPLEWIELVT